MSNLTPSTTPGWDPVPELETNTLALAGPGGPMNTQAQALLDRTESIAQGTIPPGAAITGAEVASVSQGGGIVSLTLTKIAQFIVQTYQGFTQSLTGAVSRTVFGKLSDVVSVKDFGATGNGTTDDTAAIQAALNSGALNVFFPAGTYYFTHLVMPTTIGLTLYGVGQTSQLKQYGTGISWPVLANNCFVCFHTIRNLGFDGTNGSGHTIDTTYTQNMDLMSLTFSNVPTGFASIKLNGNPTSSTFMHDVRVTDIKIYSNTAGNAGIELGAFVSDSSIDRFIMNGNFVVNYCIYMDNGACTTLVSNSHPYNAKINVVYGAGNNNYMGWDGCTIDNAEADLFYLKGSIQNRFTNCFFEAVNAGYSAVVLDNSYNNNFSVSTFAVNSAACVSCVREVNASSGNKIELATVNGSFTTPFNLTGAGSFAKSIQGYAPYGTIYNMLGVVSTALAQNTTTILGVNGANANTSNTAFPVPLTGYLMFANVEVDVTPAAGQTFTFNLQLAGTTIGTGTISNGGYSVTITPTAGLTYVTTGQQVAIQAVFSATSGSASPRYSITLNG